ncbi:MAG: amidophosphoribosyltransferase [Bacillales bacterium]|nr:amidophosphoribosyltransferase [Bacillales bacterium]
MLAEIKGLNEECGVFGIWGHQDSALVTYYGLHALQHRGQEGAGIVVTDGNDLNSHKGLGLVTEVFRTEELEHIKGKAAIGHVRYATSGGGEEKNVQPFLFRSYSDYDVALAHNGNLVNAKQLKEELEIEGSIFQSSSDTEVLAHLLRRSKAESFIEKVKMSLNKLEGAYAYLIMRDNMLVAASDPNGLRPLSLGKLGEAYVIASETCALDVVGADWIRDIDPGELVILSDEGVRFERFSETCNRAMCAMEYVYFSRPDSVIDGINVHAARKQIGKKLAVEFPVAADVIIGVPDSSISAAIGYAEQSNIPYEIGLIKNRYVARTFIQPTQELREQGVKMKLSPVRSIVEGKRVVMVDDSIVRGTTSKRIVNLLRGAGATEVHVRIGAPPITHPCFYGIDTSTREELIAATHSKEAIKELIGADSLEFVTENGLIDSIGRTCIYGENSLCTACFNGKYPTEVYEEINEGNNRLTAKC